MNDLLYSILSNTLIMSLITGIFLFARRTLGERYTPRFRYYSWLVILIGFCLPYRPTLSSHVLIEAIPSDEISFIGSHTPWLLYLYVTGLFCFLCLRIWQHSRFHQSIRRMSIPLNDGPLYASLKESCREMGFDRDFRLAVVPGLASPMMIGLFRPRILLPSTQFTETEMRLIYRHELVHYQRKDLWYKLLIEIAHGIHWFNPLLPYMKKEIEQDLEASCDQRVIFHSTREEQLVYCHAILQVVRAQGGINTALSTSFGNSKEAIQKRFEEILTTKQRKNYLAIGALVFFLTLFSGQFLFISDTKYVNIQAVWSYASEEETFQTTGVYETTYSAIYETMDPVIDETTNALYHIEHEEMSQESVVYDVVNTSVAYTEPRP